MTDALLLVLDAGTSGFRASVYSVGGERVSGRARAWAAQTPPALAPFGKAYDPEQLWATVDEVTREALAEARPEHVVGVGITGQRIACAFLDGDDETVYLGPNADVRALSAGDLRDLDGDAIYEAKGRFPPWMYAPARLRWFEAAAPEAFARIARVVSLPGWIAARMGVEAHAADPTLAADLLMVDLEGPTRAPIDSRLDEGAWPSLRAPESSLGSPHRHLCLRWGLDRSVVVATGIADTQAAVLGTLAGGDVLVGGGSAPLVRPIDEPLRDPKGRLWTSPAASRFVLEANLGEMGTMYGWLRELLGLESFDALDALAAEAEVGCLGMSAHLGPRAMNLRELSTGRPAAVLMPFGQTMGGAPAGRAELARAYLESCAFATRAGRDWLDEVTPARGPLTLVGGMSRSAQLAPILASVLGETVGRGAPDATARGAAIVAAVAAGQLADLSEGRAQLAAAPAEVAPTNVDAHEDAYERWLDREEQLEAH